MYIYIYIIILPSDIYNYVSNIYIYIYFLIYYSNPLKKDRTVEHLEVVSYLSLFLSFGDPKWRRNETVCPGWWLWGILLLDHCTHLPNLFGIVGTIVHQHICSPNYLGGIYYINYKTKHGCSSNICHSLRFITFMISSVQPQQIKDWHYDICIYNYLYLEGERERDIMILWKCRLGSHSLLPLFLGSPEVRTLFQWRGLCALDRASHGWHPMAMALKIGSWKCIPVTLWWFDIAVEHHFIIFCLLRYHLSSGGKSSISGQCSSILQFSIFFHSYMKLPEGSSG